ncbi:MAG TPA: cobalamin biosynthesis protein [Dehalococcoidales bacterium]|nr:cobalamin biosynthesis protein [Dehalococcoidales bacterium]
MDNLLILFGALVLDLALGELPRSVHPVVWMGKVISFGERGGDGHSRLIQFVYGVGISLFIIGLFTAAAYFILYYLKSLSLAAYVVIGAVLLKSTFSLRELKRVALNVKEFLLKEELNKARYELRSLVSRNTQALSPPLIVSATVESVAENTCDSFIAPLFYFLLFGVPGAIAYRAVNTLDAMIGYHGKYEYLGKFASRLDDVLNFIPARLTALLLVLASFLLRKDVRASWRVALNDHSKTESINAGWTMAAVAGALNVQLDKAGHYKLGKAGTPLIPGVIGASLQLMQISALSWVIICFAVGGVYFVLAS